MNDLTIYYHCLDLLIDNSRTKQKQHIRKKILYSWYGKSIVDKTIKQLEETTMKLKVKQEKYRYIKIPEEYTDLFIPNTFVEVTNLNKHSVKRHLKRMIEKISLSKSKTRIIKVIKKNRSKFWVDDEVFVKPI